MSFKKKITALLLSVVMIVSLVPSVSGYSLLSSASATESGTDTVAEEPSGGSTSGMEYNKTVVDNSDGTYTISLEAYATGATVITEIKEDIPTDIILVLDQSGSMANNSMSATTEADYVYYGNESNGNHYEEQGNLYYLLENGEYASVTVEVVPTYEQISSRLFANTYSAQKNNLYAKKNGEFLKVTATEQRSSSGYNRQTTYTFTLPDGTQIASVTSLNNITFENVDDGTLYVGTIDDSTVFTYTYTDEHGEVQSMQSTGNYTESGFEFYKLEPRGTVLTRVQALKDALEEFYLSVSHKARGNDGEFGTDDDVAHRIAVVGYASSSDYGYNTEILSVEGDNSKVDGVDYSVGVRYGNLTTEHYKSALQDLTTKAGDKMVNDAILALAAEGATQADLGMEMAKKILDNTPLAEGEKRNRVVIMFTDGAPNTFSGFDLKVASDAIATANEIKNDNIPVYAVGIFNGANVSVAGNRPSGDLNDSSSSITSASNWFMQNLSSNNGTPNVNGGYYLSASSSDTLNGIFKQISDSVQSGGSSTTLNSSTVIKDIIPPAFTLPTGYDVDDISLRTYKCSGKDSAGKYTWQENNDAMGATAQIVSTDASSSVRTNNQIEVTGFDFAENYVGTVNDNGDITYHGNKLVISFNIVERKGFLGGNGVFTNEFAGIYENAEATSPVITFNKPTVDVELADVVAGESEANVYLGAYLFEDVTLQSIKENALSVSIGGYELDFSPNAVNFGLEEWQNEYVDIKIELIDENGNSVESFDNMTEDRSYTVKVTVSPINNGTEDAVEATASGKINVFKPEITYRDATAYYGASVLGSLDAYKENAEWRHSDKSSTDSDVEMLGAMPALSYSYSYKNESDIYTDGSGNEFYNTTNDIPVGVSVTETLYNSTTQDITDYVTFKHTDCADGCDWTETDGTAFLVHIKTCSITVTKNVKDDKAYDGQKFLFNITGETNIHFDVVETVALENGQSVTITGLPVGTYTVTEDENWSWRYEAEDYVEAVEVSADDLNGSITVTNSRVEQKWLDTDSYAQNVFADNKVYAFKKKELGEPIKITD